MLLKSKSLWTFLVGRGQGHICLQLTPLAHGRLLRGVGQGIAGLPGRG